jgi:hypothetical protein
MTRLNSSVVVLACSILLAGCGSESPTTPSTTPTATTETFSSSVPYRGTISRSLTTSSAGAITATLTMLGQDGASVRIGLGVRNDGANQCLPTYSLVTTPHSGRQLAVEADVGSYCVTVADIGELSGPSSFSLTIVHY